MNIELLDAIGTILMYAILALLAWTVRKVGKEKMVDIFKQFQIWVAAMEQIGEIKGWDGEKKFYEVFEKAKEKYPKLKSIEIQDLIEAAVYIIKNKGDKLKEKWEELE